ncbi:MAG: phage terminase large subunit family protein [Bryobacteraceae bacterium]
MTAEARLIADCSRLWQSPPKQKLSEWAEENFILSPEYSAHSGRLSLYQFQREPLDAFTNPYVRHIVLMTCTQLIKTLLQQVAIAYVIARAPGPILWAHPSDTDAETISKERLSPMIRDMPCLTGKVAPEKRTSKSNTILHKVFPGGSLSLIGAQTPGNFARRSIRYFLADERDKWKANVGKEGDGFSLGVKRTATFRSLAKIIEACSPTIEGNSQIAAAYENSDQRKFWVPCPQCGARQILKWGQVRDPRFKGKQTADTRYECEHCGAQWPDVERWEAVERGEWRADKPFAGTAGFWISELYSPWKKLGDLVADFLSKKDSPSELQTFVNTTLAETWKEQGDAPDHEKLMVRREDSYRLGQAPIGVVFLTAGVDVQKTWIEVYVWGWGRGRQRWVVDHFRIERSPFDQAAWDALTEILNQAYQRQDGAALSIVRMAVDTGFASNEVYQWARQQGAGRVMAVDGRQHLAALVAAPTQVDVTVSGRKIRHGAKLWPVDVSACKSELYGLLGKERPAEGEPYPTGWVHFPKDLDEEFFRQLTAESLTTHVVKGYRKTEWIKTRERNEALDCANYARAAAFVSGWDKHGANETWWQGMQGAVEAAAQRAEKQPTPAASQPKSAYVPPSRRRIVGRMAL